MCSVRADHVISAFGSELSGDMPLNPLKLNRWGTSVHVLTTATTRPFSLSLSLSLSHTHTHTHTPRTPRRTPGNMPRHAIIFRARHLVIATLDYLMFNHSRILDPSTLTAQQQQHTYTHKYTHTHTHTHKYTNTQIHTRVGLAILRVAGDIGGFAHTTVEATNDGKVAAASMHRYLQGALRCIACSLDRSHMCMHGCAREEGFIDFFFFLSLGYSACARIRLQHACQRHGCMRVA